MNTDDLAAALRNCAAGLYPLEAGTELLISQRHVPAPRRLHQPVHRPRHKRRHPDGRHRLGRRHHRPHAGELPCSGGERRILQLSASLAAGTPVSLRDTVTGLDDDNTARLLTAIRHATGKRSETAITARLVMAKSSHSMGG